jgi:hypothetical protein
VRPGFLVAVGWLVAIAVGSAFGLGLVSTRKVTALVRGPGEIDEALACELVVDFTNIRRSHCDGSLETMGDVARLSGVNLYGAVRTFCFARLDGAWVVLRDTANGPCFSTAPASREAEKARLVAEVRSLFDERMQGVIAALERAEPLPNRCPDTVWAIVPMLEPSWLGGNRTEEGWEFLTTSWLRDALDEPNDEQVLAAMKAWGKARHVAVVTATQRTRARMGLTVEGIRLPFDWRRGSFAGRVRLVDARDGVGLCEGTLGFASSESLKPRTTSFVAGGKTVVLPVPDLPSQTRVEEDFKDRYHTALTETLQTISGYRVSPMRD